MNGLVVRRMATGLVAATVVSASGSVGASAQTDPAARRPASTGAQPQTPPAAGDAASSGIRSLTPTRVRAALGEAASDVSFSVKDRRSGKVFTYNAGLRNSMGSTAKVLVLAALCHARREQGQSLTSKQKSLADRMIRHSDNDATNELLAQAGGSWALREAARSLGMRSTSMSAVWGLSTTSAVDERLLMDRLVDGTAYLSAHDRRYILGLMTRVTREQGWGVGDVASGRVAVKNGWVPVPPRGWRVNSMGRVNGSGRDYTLAVLTYDNPDEAIGIKRTRQVSSLVWTALSPAGASSGTASSSSSSVSPASPAGAVGGRSASVAAAVPTPKRFWIRPGGAVAPHPFG